jgi:hypothetical protein
MPPEDKADKPDKPQAKAPKPEKGEGKAQKGDQKAGKSKGQADAAAEAPKAKPPAPPRPPADPRLKVIKKFHGKFLPRGPLRERHKTVMARWNSGEDHGGVTVEELRSLLNDWKASRKKSTRAASV